MDSDERERKALEQQERETLLRREFRRLRKERGLSQQDVGVALDKTKQWYQKIENGKTRLTIERIAQLCRFYGVALESLVPSEQSSMNELAEQAARFEPAPVALSLADQQILSAFRCIESSETRAAILHIIGALAR